MAGSYTPLVDYDKVSSYITTFDTNYRLKASKGESLILSLLGDRVKPWSGKAMEVDVVTPHTKDQIAAPATRGAATSYSNTLSVKRRMSPIEKEYAELTEWADIESKLTNPQGRVYDSVLAAFWDWIDYQVLTNALANVTELYTDTDGIEQLDAAVALPNASVVADTTNAGFTWDRFLLIEKTMRDNGVQFGMEDIFLFVGTEQNRQIKTDTIIKEMVITQDFPFGNGMKFDKINNTWIIPTPLLSTSTVSGRTHRNCIALTPSALDIAITPMVFDVATNAERRHEASMFFRRVIGATRVDDAKICKFQADDAALTDPAS